MKASSVRCRAGRAAQRAGPRASSGLATATPSSENLQPARGSSSPPPRPPRLRSRPGCEHTAARHRHSGRRSRLRLCLSRSSHYFSVTMLRKPVRLDEIRTFSDHRRNRSVNITTAPVDAVRVDGYGGGAPLRGYGSRCCANSGNRNWAALLWPPSRAASAARIFGAITDLTASTVQMTAPALAPALPARRNTRRPKVQREPRPGAAAAANAAVSRSRPSARRSGFAACVAGSPPIVPTSVAPRPPRNRGKIRKLTLSHLHLA